MSLTRSLRSCIAQEKPGANPVPQAQTYGSEAVNHRFRRIWPLRRSATSTQGELARPDRRA